MTDRLPAGSTIEVRHADGRSIQRSAPRLPGEPLYVAVLRELAEECGIVDVTPYPVDLSGDWGLFHVDCAAAPVEFDQTGTAHLGGQAVGWVRYHPAGNDSISIDFSLDADAPRIIWAYLTRLALPAHPTAVRVLGGPPEAGFRDGVLDVAHAIGAHPSYPSARFRPAVRVLCLDGSGRVLLMHWRDPFDGSYLWEPPGGGMEPGETAYQTARRELVEETGLDSAAIEERSMPVWRDVTWNGRHYVGTERFFVARFPTERPDLARGGLLPDEVLNLAGYEWVPWGELSDLADPVEPPALLTVLSQLAPDGPWASAP